VRRRVLALLLLALAGTPAGCAAFGPSDLDVPPGQRVVLGRLDVADFETPVAVVEIVKEDGTFGQELHAGPGRGEFAITLPPGRYRVVRVRGMKERSVAPSDALWPLRGAFEVGSEPATYIGTLRLASRLGSAPRVSVVDEYEDTLRVLRGLYRDLPSAVVRRLVTLA
jgi:hypothetical protein